MKWFLLAVVALSVVVQVAHSQTVVPLRARKTSLLTRRSATLAVGSPIHLTGNLTYWGEYFATVGLGTPPQYLNLQVDTGKSWPQHLRLRSFCGSFSHLFFLFSGNDCRLALRKGGLS